MQKVEKLIIVASHYKVFPFASNDKKTRKKANSAKPSDPNFILGSDKKCGITLRIHLVFFIIIGISTDEPKQGQEKRET